MKETLTERREPAQERSRERRRRVLDAVYELVRERGTTEGITSRQVADKAEIPIGSFYYLFPNLRAAYYVLLSELLESAGQKETGRRRKGAGWEGELDAALDRLFSFFWKNSVVSTLWNGLRNDPELQELNRIDNERWEARNLDFLRRTLPALGDRRRRTMAKMMVYISEVVLSESINTPSQRMRAALATELKRNLRAYVESSRT